MNCSFCAAAMPAPRPDAAIATAAIASTVRNSLIFASLVELISGLLGSLRLRCKVSQLGELVKDSRRRRNTGCRSPAAEALCVLRDGPAGARRDEAKLSMA